MQRRHAAKNIPIEALRSFVAVLDAGSFTKAAAALSVTQPSITYQIKRLEALVGGSLFTNGALTKKGESVSRHARRILAINDQIIGEARGASQKIRVGIPSFSLGTTLRKVISICGTLEIKNIHFVCEASSVLFKTFNAGHLEAMIAYTPRENPAALASWREPMVWVSSPDFILQPGRPLPLQIWPDSPSDEISHEACARGRILYEHAFVASDLNSHLAALHSRIGIMAIARRAVPADLKIISHFSLPPLADIHGGIYVNEDAYQLETVIQCLMQSVGLDDSASLDKRIRHPA